MLSVLQRGAGAGPLLRFCALVGAQAPALALRWAKRRRGARPVCPVCGCGRRRRLGGAARALAALSRGGLGFTPQPDEGVTYAKKITNNDSRIDWAAAAAAVATPEDDEDDDAELLRSKLIASLQVKNKMVPVNKDETADQNTQVSSSPSMQESSSSPIKADAAQAKAKAPEGSEGQKDVK